MPLPDLEYLAVEAAKTRQTGWVLYDANGLHFGILCVPADAMSEDMFAQYVAGKFTRELDEAAGLTPEFGHFHSGPGGADDGYAAE